MKRTLIIFIDGLPYDLAIEKMSILKDAKSGPIIAGIGFSNNIYPEILCGTNPDEIGYFNEWSPKPNLDSQKKMFLLSFLDIFRNSLYINAGIRKIILKKIFDINFSNIPFKYAHYFKPQGSHDFKDLGSDSLLSKHNFLILDSVDETGGVGNRDSKIVQKFLASEVPDKNLFLSFVDLDNIAHINKNASQIHLDHLKYLDDQLRKIIDKYKSKHQECNVFLFSDHGMVNVDNENHVKLMLEKEFGEMHPNTYLYFVDSTYLRVWVKNGSLRNRIEQYLKNLDFGKLLSKKERIEFGLTKIEFGDFIFRTNEGICFTPNFYGARKVKAMHGYNSYLTSQKGIFSDLNNLKDQAFPKRSKDIYSYLFNILEKNAE
jgi:predicted AlkP superfamily pyrophosphatase or phosphodiesterase